MIGEKKFDERQLIVRGKVGFQTTLLSVTLIFISALFTDEIMKYVEMSDYLICLAQIIIAYLSVNLMLHDAYVGLYENGSIKMFMFVLLCLFFVMVGILIFDWFNSGQPFSSEHVIGYSSMLFSGSVSFTFFMKQRMEKIYDK